MKKLKIATRSSLLALWQAEYVKQTLINQNPRLQVELIKMTTEGDRFLDAPLIAIGGKGLFIKELEQTLLDGIADIAVHSMKDVTTEIPDGLALPVIMKREDSRDVLVSNHYKQIRDIPEGCVVGTSSLRRQSQLNTLFSGMVIKNLRGNLDTRLRKLDDGKYDAIILAAAGIKRLGLNDRIAQFIPHSQMLPAIGQGAIGIECRKNDKRVLEIIMPLNDSITHLCIQAERVFSHHLYGGCQLPIAGQASVFDDKISLTGMVARVDGSEVIKDRLTDSINNASTIGNRLAKLLIERGAEKILKELID